MKREIKFRFWDLDTKRMITHHEGITQNPLGKSLSTNLRPLIRISGEICQPHWGKNCITMQYTGLKDNKGKEIYEGDIVIMDYGGTYTPHKRVIEWRGAGFYTYREIKNSDCKFELLPLQICNDCFCEVIGNIYETPELLNP